jgi:hypothetical protein
VGERLEQREEGEHRQRNRPASACGRCLSDSQPKKMKNGVPAQRTASSKLAVVPSTFSDLVRKNSA